MDFTNVDGVHHVARGKDYALANGYEQLVEERGSFAFVNTVAYPGGFEVAELEITKAVFPGAGVGYKALAVELAQRDSGAVRQTMEAWQQQVLA